MRCGASSASDDHGYAVYFKEVGLHPFGVVVDLGHVLPQDPAGYVLRGDWTTWLMRMRLAM